MYMQVYIAPLSDTSQPPVQWQQQQGRHCQRQRRAERQLQLLRHIGRRSDGRREDAEKAQLWTGQEGPSRRRGEKRDWRIFAICIYIYIIYNYTNVDIYSWTTHHSWWSLVLQTTECLELLQECVVLTLNIFLYLGDAELGFGCHIIHLEIWGFL